MLDPKLLRESPDLVRAAIAKKHLQVDLDGVLAIDASWRALLQETEGLRAKQKAANTAMAALPKGSPEFQAKVGEIRASDRSELAGASRWARPWRKQPSSCSLVRTALSTATSCALA